MFSSTTMGWFPNAGEHHEPSAGAIVGAAVEEERKQGSKARPRLLEAWLSLQALLQWYRCRTAAAATINAAVQGSSTTALARGHSLALDSSFAEEIFLSTTTSKLAVGC